MLRRVGKLKADALAMPAGRKTPALDHRHLVRHVGMRRIVSDGVDAGLRNNLARPVSCAMVSSEENLSTIYETERN